MTACPDPCCTELHTVRRRQRHGFDIPSIVLAQCARIEVVFDPERTLDGWTCELLEAATRVTALVVEIERTLGRPPQFARIRRDGAAPLIGSSEAIRQVRDRIEKVAARDFAILIEGGFGPEPHAGAAVPRPAAFD